MFSFLKNLFGVGLPRSGQVVSKHIDNVRFVNYAGEVGIKSINDEPIYWLGIKEGNNDPRYVKVSRVEYEAIKEGGTWIARN